MALNHLEKSKDFIKSLKLAAHPEGGYFAVTYVDKEVVKSPLAKGVYVALHTSQRISILYR